MRPRFQTSNVNLSDATICILSASQRGVIAISRPTASQMYNVYMMLDVGLCQTE